MLAISYLSTGCTTTTCKHTHCYIYNPFRSISPAYNNTIVDSNTIQSNIACDFHHLTHSLTPPRLFFIRSLQKIVRAHPCVGPERNLNLNQPHIHNDDGHFYILEIGVYFIGLTRTHFQHV